MHILVVAATKMELRSLLPEISTKDIKTGEVSLINKKDKKIYALVSGIGPINAAIYTQKALMNYNIQGIINIGIAGAFDTKKIPIGSITISKKEIWPEYGLKTKDNIDPKGLNFGIAKLKSGKIIYNEIDIPYEQAMRKMGLSFDNNFYTTVNLTVAGVSGDRQTALKLKEQFNPDIENMEGFSIAYLALLYDIPFLEIRTISNEVGVRGIYNWNIKMALHSLKSLTQIFN